MQRTIWQALLATTILGCLALFFLSSSPYSQSRLLQQQQTSVDQVYEDDNESFQWKSKSAFRHVTKGTAKNARVEELCKSFPKEKLEYIQPVLKSGHGAMHRVREQLNSSAACLDNLLIFSDMDEEVAGRAVIDTIADIPQKLIDSDDQTLPYRRLKQYVINGTLDEADESKLPGWETDKFKFLPDVSRAWRISPDKKWYVFFEGDTYIVWDTLFRLLEHFNPDIPHYFGSPSPGRDGMWFANGGPGLILSRGAMQKLVQYDYTWRNMKYRGSKLAEKHWHETLVNCCGDSILGWALWEEAVKLEGLWPMFNPHPPHGVPFSELYWCQPVLSMHKPKDDIAERLWRWEWRERSMERPLLYRDLATSFYESFQSPSIRKDWDNADWDGFEPPKYQAAHTSVERCQEACTKHNLCMQWTYHLKRCWFVRSFRLGQAKEPRVEDDRKDEKWLEEDKTYVAGWDTVKIKKWIEERPCTEVQWVKPSTERIF
ncbi:hypothetical protein CBER1_05801 [Cercospora berteroae]|uniref:N-acetylgalactosaminide beta-1,3-galactosyltransferase n=1 Tax=Cercospora berteroae TaxID=357750 RepID=A0A2S6CI18_9PEZI|nr:hypothetical protein CBER1_05801 [Cercospora berteroae]